MPVVTTVWFCLQGFRRQLSLGNLFSRGCMNGMHQGIPVGSSSRSCHKCVSSSRKVGPRKGFGSLRTLAFLCLVCPVQCLESMRDRGGRFSAWDHGLASPTELPIPRWTSFGSEVPTKSEQTGSNHDRSSLSRAVALMPTGVMHHGRAAPFEQVCCLRFKIPIEWALFDRFRPLHVSQHKCRLHKVYHSHGFCFNATLDEPDTCRVFAVSPSRGDVTFLPSWSGGTIQCRWRKALNHAAQAYFHPCQPQLCFRLNHLEILTMLMVNKVYLRAAVVKPSPTSLRHQGHAVVAKSGHVRPLFDSQHKSRLHKVYRQPQQVAFQRRSAADRTFACELAKGCRVVLGSSPPTPVTCTRNLPKSCLFTIESFLLRSTPQGSRAGIVDFRVELVPPRAHLWDMVTSGFAFRGSQECTALPFHGSIGPLDVCWHIRLKLRVHPRLSFAACLRKLAVDRHVEPVLFSRGNGASMHCQQDFVVPIWGLLGGSRASALSTEFPALIWALCESFVQTNFVRIGSNCDGLGPSRAVALMPIGAVHLGKAASFVRVYCLQFHFLVARALFGHVRPHLVSQHKRRLHKVHHRHGLIATLDEPDTCRVFAVSPILGDETASPSRLMSTPGAHLARKKQHGSAVKSMGAEDVDDAARSGPHFRHHRGLKTDILNISAVLEGKILVNAAWFDRVFFFLSQHNSRLHKVYPWLSSSTDTVEHCTRKAFAAPPTRGCGEDGLPDGPILCTLAFPWKCLQDIAVAPRPRDGHLGLVGPAQLLVSLWRCKHGLADFDQVESSFTSHHKSRLHRVHPYCRLEAACGRHTPHSKIMPCTKWPKVLRSPTRGDPAKHHFVFIPPDGSIFEDSSNRIRDRVIAKDVGNPVLGPTRRPLTAAYVLKFGGMSCEDEGNASGLDRPSASLDVGLVQLPPTARSGISIVSPPRCDFLHWTCTATVAKFRPGSALGLGLQSLGGTREGGLMPSAFHAWGAVELLSPQDSTALPPMLPPRMVCTVVSRTPTRPEGLGRLPETTPCAPQGMPSIPLWSLVASCPKVMHAAPSQPLDGGDNVRDTYFNCLRLGRRWTPVQCTVPMPNHPSLAHCKWVAFATDVRFLFPVSEEQRVRPYDRPRHVSVSYLVRVIVMRSCRIGEALVPGPCPDATGALTGEWSLGAINPSGLLFKSDHIRDLPPGIFAISESSLTHAGEHKVRRELKLLSQVAHGPPSAL